MSSQFVNWNHDIKKYETKKSRKKKQEKEIVLNNLYNFFEGREKNS